MELAVNVGAVATPDAFVVAVAVLAPPVNVPLAPVLGAANVTITPLTGLPPASFAVACSAVAKAALITALCGVPAVAVIELGAPAVFVKEKFAGVATPGAVAITV